MPSTLRLVVDSALPADTAGVVELIGTRRDEGASWRAIRDEIHQLTGIHLGHETVRRWAPKGGNTNAQ